jgi:hypothetical protein
MPRRKDPRILDAVLDQLLADTGADPKGPIECPTGMTFTKSRKYQHAHSPSTCLPGLVEGFVVVAVLPSVQSRGPSRGGGQSARRAVKPT